MTPGPGQHHDPTSGLAAGDLAGESLVTEILSRVEDQRDRVFLLAHVGLDIPLSTLSRELKVGRAELASRIDAILGSLRNDATLSASVGDICRAGRTERYQALAFRLNLLDWFCSQCGEFMNQPRTGRPRRTCSDTCRGKFHRAGGTGWKDRHQPGSPGNDSPEADAISKGGTWRDKWQPISSTSPWAGHPPWPHAPRPCRNRALALLGLACPAPATPSHLAALDTDDIALKHDGLNVRLFRRDKRPTRYVTIPASDDGVLCPVRSVLAWREHLTQAGFVHGPLFVRLDEDGQVTRGNMRMTSITTAWAIADAVQAGLKSGIPDLKPSTILQDFAEKIP